MTDDGVKIIPSVEAERRFYGSHWDEHITLIVVPAENPDKVFSVDLLVPQARKLASDLIGLVRASGDDTT